MPGGGAPRSWVTSGNSKISHNSRAALRGRTLTYWSLIMSPFYALLWTARRDALLRPAMQAEERRVPLRSGNIDR